MYLDQEDEHDVVMSKASRNGTLNDVSFHTVIAVTGETLNVSVKKQHTSGGG